MQYVLRTVRLDIITYAAYVELAAQLGVSVSVLMGDWLTRTLPVASAAYTAVARSIEQVVKRAGEHEAPFTCKYCGSPSWIDPSDQSPPSDYCHEIDHGTGR